MRRAYSISDAFIPASSRANTAFHLLVKMHKAFSGFIQSASYWQVLRWQLWKTSLTKKKAECLCGRTKGHAWILEEILLSSNSLTLLSLPLKWIDQQCRAHPIRKCLRDRRRCFRPEQHLSAKTSRWKSKAQHFHLKSCQGNAAFRGLELLMVLIRFYGCDRSHSSVCFLESKTGID